MDTWQLGAAQASAAMAAGQLTSEQLTRACLERIAAREPLVHAWAHLDAEHALAQARARDREPRRSALHGIPIGFKDVIRTCDLPTRHNSPIYAGHQPNEDASCVATLRALGAVVLGKTETHWTWSAPRADRRPGLALQWPTAWFRWRSARRRADRPSARRLFVVFMP